MASGIVLNCDPGTVGSKDVPCNFPRNGGPNASSRLIDAPFASMSPAISGTATGTENYKIIAPGPAN